MSSTARSATSRSCSAAAAWSPSPDPRAARAAGCYASRAMDDRLRELEVLSLDCQASGSTPAYGDLLELGWASCTAAGLAGPVRSRWIVPRTGRPIPWPARELIGWTAACVADSIDERLAWAELRADVAA